MTARTSETTAPFPAIIIGVDRDHDRKWCDGKAFIEVSCHACFERHEFFGAWTATTIHDAVGEVTRHCPETGRRLEILDADDVVGDYLREELDWTHRGMDLARQKETGGA